MYLAKYIICAFIFVTALLFAIRTCSGTSLHTWHGKLARGVLTLLLVAAVVVVWYYATEENFGITAVVWTARIGSILLVLFALPDVWSDAKKIKSTPAQEEPATEEHTEAVTEPDGDKD